MKIPLHYQITEYDCGPTCILNGISYLFEREEIPPEIIRTVMLFCLDHYGTEGMSGIIGTTHTAMSFLSHWLNEFGKKGKMRISCCYLQGKSVTLRGCSRLRSSIEGDGVAVVRVDLEGWHYVLLTGIDDDNAYVFDPYQYPDPFPVSDVQKIDDHEFSYNRIVPIDRFESTEMHMYSFGPLDQREAVLMFKSGAIG